MGKKKKKYVVYLLTPHTIWRGVEATSKKEAISKCEAPELDGNDVEYAVFRALEQEEEDGG